MKKLNTSHYEGNTDNYNLNAKERTLRVDSSRNNLFWLPQHYLMGHLTARSSGFKPLSPLCSPV